MNKDLIIEKQIKKLNLIIDAYQVFTKWILRHTSDIHDSQRGRDCLAEIDQREREYREFEQSELSALRDDKEEKLICPNCGSTSEHYATLNKGHCRNCGKLWTVSNTNKVQSSPQPQPGRGAEEFVNSKLGDKKYTHSPYTMYREEIVKWLQEYRTQSEGKDMYPKEFVEWLLNFANIEIEDDEFWWKIMIEDHIVELMSTDTAFNHWSNNHK